MSNLRPLSGQANSRIPIPPRGEPIARYETYLDAQRAVDFLSDQQFPVQAVTIVGTGLRMVERVTGRLTYPRVAGASALSGLYFGFFVGLALTLFGGGNDLSIFAVALVGAGFGMLFGIISYALTGGRRDFTSTSQIVASEYEVLCLAEQAGTARELLSRLPGGARGRVVGEGGPGGIGSGPGGFGHGAPGGPGGAGTSGGPGGPGAAAGPGAAGPGPAGPGPAGPGYPWSGGYSGQPGGGPYPGNPYGAPGQGSGQAPGQGPGQAPGQTPGQSPPSYPPPTGAPSPYGPPPSPAAGAQPGAQGWAPGAAGPGGEEPAPTQLVGPTYGEMMERRRQEQRAREAAEREAREAAERQDAERRAAQQRAEQAAAEHASAERASRDDALREPGSGSGRSDDPGA